ncbi:MAG TPA: phosphohydrolase [Balneolaceae bacterium]|nr:phosphohydrolase [Balneolaceae bacterium]
MKEEELVSLTEQYVRQTLEGEGSGHDWWHIHRVRNMALHISGVEHADSLIVELAALLHDIADHKFHDGDEEIGTETARKWLVKIGASDSIITQITTIIKEVSFKGAGVATPMSSLEGKIVQDADRLDAIGATGIARAFAYGGHKNRLLYDPSIPPEMHDSFDTYKKSTAPTINHFYEKLLLLKDRMNTKTGKKLAEERHQFMLAYLDRFMNEWDGNK